MSLFDRFRESRALSYQTIFRTGLDTFPPRPESGFFVDADSAMRNPAIWAAQRLIAGDISTLPVEAFVKDDTGTRKPLRPKPAWIEEPDPADPSLTRNTHFAEVALSLLQNGNSFTFCEPSVFNVQRVEVLSPKLVNVVKPGRSPEYHVTDARGKVIDKLTPANIIHIAPFRKPGALRGLDPIAAAAEGIGISLAAERYTSRYFLNGASMPGFIKWPDDRTQDQLDEADKQLRKAKGGWRNAGVIGHLTGGADYIPTGITPQNSDLSGIRQFQIEEACRIYGIPPHMLGVAEKGAGGPASVEQRSIDYITHALRHYLEPIEIAYRRLIPGDTATYLKFNVAGLLRGDIAARYLAYNIGIRDGFLSINDVRRLEDMSPVDGGDAYRVQAQMTDITAEPAVPAGPGGNVTGPPLEPASPAATQNTRSLGDGMSDERESNRLIELVGAFARTADSLADRPIHVHVPEQLPPIVHVDAPVVHVAPPEVRVAAPEPTVIHVHVPEQPAPVVTVNVPAVKRTKKTVTRNDDNTYTIVES